MEAYEPDVVAVELPPTIRRAFLDGVKRLPLLSVVHYREEDGTFVYLPVEPTDGQVEAVRLALERGLPVHFIDRDTEGYPFDRSPMPDPYALTRIGHFEYCRAYLRATRGAVRAPQDELRERTMAFHLQALRLKELRVLFVGGLYHLPGILEHLERPQTEVIGRRHREGVGLAHLHEESSREVMTEMPFLAGAYESFRSSSGAPVPDRLEVQQALLRAARGGYWKNSREELNQAQVRVLNTFARNYAFMTGGPGPGFLPARGGGPGGGGRQLRLRGLGEGERVSLADGEPGDPGPSTAGRGPLSGPETDSFPPAGQDPPPQARAGPRPEEGDETGTGVVEKGLQRSSHLFLPSRGRSGGGVRRLPQEEGPGDQGRGERTGGPLHLLHARRAGCKADPSGTGTEEPSMSGRNGRSAAAWDPWW